jgi:hypothetical protein
MKAWKDPKAWILALLLAVSVTQAGCAFLAGAAVGAAGNEAADDDDD